MPTQQATFTPFDNSTQGAPGQLDPNLIALFSQLSDFLSPKRGEDPLMANLDRYMVSPTRGFFSYPMGGMAGSIPSIPGAYQMDTINNTPGNLPGGAGGKFDLAQNSLQENDVYTVNSMMPFSEPIWGNKLLQPTPFHRLQMGGPVNDILSLFYPNQFDRGGRIQRRQERLERRRDRLERRGKTDSAAYTRVTDRLADIASGGRGQSQFGNIIHGIGQIPKGVADFSLGMIGAGDLIQDSFVDRSKLLSGVSNALGKIAPIALNAVAPGAGLAVGALGSGLNSLGQGQQAQTNVGDVGGLGNASGQLPYGTGFGTQFQGLGQNSLMAPLMGFGNMGGFNPIQNITAGIGQSQNLGDILAQISALQPQFGATPGIAGGQIPSFPLGGLIPYGNGPSKGGGGIGNIFEYLQQQGGANTPTNNMPMGSQPMMGGGIGNIFQMLGGLFQGQQGQQPMAASGINAVQTPRKFKKGDKVGNKIKKIMKEGIRGKKVSRDQAIAVTLDMERRGKLQYGGFARYPLGGEVSGPAALVPIQTELGEMIVHPNFLITQVNATKKHRSMDDDEVTDILSEESYILSNDPKMAIKKKTAEDIIMGMKSQPYSEDEQAMQPEVIDFSELWHKDKMTPAELGMAIRNKFPIINKYRNFEYSDVFTENTNKANLASRAKWLEVLMALNEFKKMGSDSPIKFKHGGKVHKPLRMSNIPKAQGGSDFWNILATAAPGIISLITGGGQNSGMDPMSQAAIYGSLPIDQAAFQANVGARDQALGQGIQDFTGLGQYLNQTALGTAGAGILGNLFQETQLPRFDYSSARARLNNFNTQTPRNFAEALSRPTYDTRAILQELGPRAGTALAGLDANRINARNSAMINQFNQDRNLGFNVMQGLNQVDIGEQQANMPLQLQEIEARNAQRSGVFNQFGDLFNRLGQNASNILPITTGFNLERANLVGQPGMRAARNLMNAGQLGIAANQQQPGQGGQQPFNIWEWLGIKKPPTATGSTGSTYGGNQGDFFSNMQYGNSDPYCSQIGLCSDGMGGCRAC